MAKFPFIQLYIHDHCNDEKLILCSLATFGLWTRFVGAMHLANRCGLISGSREHLATIGRCTAVEVASALDELSKTGAAEVTERNGIVTVVNRRMRREWKSRNSNRLRVQNHRKKEKKPKPVMGKSHYGSSSGSSSSVSGEEGTGEKPIPPSPTPSPEMLIYAEYPRKVARPDALKAIKKAIEKVGFEPLLEMTKAYARTIKDADHQFTPYPASWFNQEGYNDGEKMWNLHGGLPKASAMRTASPQDIRNVIEAKKVLANDIRNRHSSECATGTSWSNLEKKREYFNIHKEIKDLTQRLATML